MCGTLDAQLNAALTEVDSHRSGPAATRRSALLGVLGIGGGMAAAAALPAPSYAAGSAPSTGTAAAAATGDRLVMLGTNGGPKLNTGLAKPALALVVNERTYLIDCGYDTANQMVKAGLGFPTVQDVFITHHHLDHTSGIPGLFLHGWTNPQRIADFGLWGPPRMSPMMAGIEKSFGQEIELFETGGGFPALPVVTTHDIMLKKKSPLAWVMEDDHVIVHATRVSHGPEVANPYAYRFTIKSSGKKVVFSGDTAAPNANLIELAAGCDFLVHEAQDNDLIPVLLQFVPPSQREPLQQHLLESHSNVIDLPGVAKAAGANNLVLSHYTPLPQPASVFLTKAQSAASAAGYTGTIIAPNDLDVIVI